VLAEVPAVVFPVVRRRVQHTEIRCGRMIEELGHVVIREGIRVVPPVRVGVGELGLEARECGR